MKSGKTAVVRERTRRESRGARPAAEAGYTPKRVTERSRRTSGVRQLLRIVIPALLLVALAGGLFAIARKNTEYRFTATAKQFYGGQSFQIPSGVRMLREGKNATRLKGEALDREMDALPVYYDDQQTVVLPQDMIYYAAGSGDGLRVEHFSELTYTRLGVQEISLRKKTEPMQTGFLYDGGDIYLFLVPVRLSVNGAAIELGAMSCLEADARIGMISVYNTDGDMLFEEMKSRCEVSPASQEYTVYLLDDSMELRDGTRMLLFSEPQELEPLF